MLGRIVGRYRVVEKLGEGGMGSVWKAEDPLLGRTVALKFLPETLRHSEDALRRFRREARLTSALHHPGIAPLFHADFDGDDLYIAVAYVDGETLAAQIERGPLEVAEATRIAADVAEALEHAHVNGVLHRDITSRNIMRTRAGATVLIDFGLAMHPDTTRITSSRAMIGTAAYIPPEIVAGCAPDRRGDLYSLGVVLYEMLTGHLPFRGDVHAAILYAVLHTRPPALRSYRPEIPVALERFVLRAMARDPAKRPHSAAEMAEWLRRPLRISKTRRTPAARPRTPGPPRGDARLPRDACLAVLPLQIIAPAMDPGEEALAQGIGVSLGAVLSRVAGLQVIAPSEAMLDAAFVADPMAGARRLGATLALTASVQRSADQLRINYSILETRRGRQVAADQVDGSTERLFDLQDAMFSSVLRALRVGTAAAGRRDPRLAHTGSHAPYLQALGWMQRSDRPEAAAEAVGLLEGLLAEEGDTALVHAALGRAYLLRFGHTHDPGWLQKAEQSCRIAMHLDPHSPSALVTLARLDLEQGRAEQAVRTLDQALELHPQLYDALIYQSRALESLGRLDDAKAVVRRAIDLRPGDWTGHNRLGLIEYRQGRYAETAAAWEEVVALRPDSARAHANLGSAYFHLGKLDEALACFERSIGADPNASAYTSAGTVHFFEGRPRRAFEAFQKAVELQPRDARTWGNLGDAQRWTPGMREASVASFDRAIELMRADLQRNEADAGAWAQLALWLAKRGHAAESLEAIDRALRLAPSNVEAVARSISVYHLAGREDQALRSLESAVALGYGRTELVRDPELETLRRRSDARRILKDGDSDQAGSPRAAENGGRA